MPTPVTLTRRFHPFTGKERSTELYRTPIHTEMATEEELLEFANKLREVGGAEPLEALLPSNPAHSQDCLIANAVNFGITVDSFGGNATCDPDGSLLWILDLPYNMAPERRKEIAVALGLKETYGSYDYISLRLPKEIGNAAHAFDSGDAYQEYRKDRSADSH